METFTFQHALEIEVATLQATFPVLADGIGRARALLADGLVFPLEDGHSADVCSSADPTVSYRVNGTCPCPASQYRDEPCKHRLAYRLYQRVSSRLTAAGADGPPSPPPLPATFPEAPASVNVRVLVQGRDCQFTLRDTDEVRLGDRLAQLLARYCPPTPSVQGEDYA